jgi:hypothetical protein
MGDTGKTSDKGKEKATLPFKARDFVRNQEKLKLDPQRDILKGGAGSSSDAKLLKQIERMQDEHKRENDILYEAQTKQVDQFRRRQRTQAEWEQLNQLHKQQRSIVQDRQTREMNHLTGNN